MRKKFLYVLLALCLLLAFTAQAEENDYAQVKASWDNLPRGSQDVSVNLDTCQATDITLTEKTVDGVPCLEWLTASGSVTFTVEVPQAGLYNIAFRYTQSDASGTQIERGLLINGQMQYAEMNNFLLPKQFSDAAYPFEKNEYGNDVLPRQTAVYALREEVLRDRDAFYGEKLLFWFEQGTNTLTLTGVKGSLVLSGITLLAPKDALPYADTDLSLADNASGVRMVEAENIAVRSSKSIQNLTVSEPGITPEEAGHKLLNTIGGSNWNKAQDYVSWQVTVENDGYYQLAFDYKQSFNTAMTSFRRLEVDGVVPFAEAENIAFPFGAGWQQKLLGGDAPYLLYLTKGQHTLRLYCSNAPYRQVYNRLSAVVSELKALDLSVKEIIGTNDDVYRIWKLESYLPNIAADLQRMTDEMGQVLSELTAIIGESAELGNLSASVTDLAKLAADPNHITKNSDQLSNIYTVFTDWMDNMMSQPLQLDKFYLAAANESIPKAGASFFSSVGYTFSNFFASFFQSGDDRGAEEENTVTVWVQRSRDYVDMMQLLADEYYTKETGVKVNVSYCPPGTQLLVLANASGGQPDIVTGVDITLPFEFGIRNALVDLSGLDGFEELVSHVAQGSRIPNYFSGAEYGIAEEIRVKVMFYRKDVLSRLGIPVPETWEDARKALSTLLQNNYAFFYPYGDYLTFFFQNGVDVYTPDGLSLGFVNENGFKAYQQWTDLYVKYGLQAEMSSFYQHFRIGDVPLGIADIDQYIQFDLAAPDISGLWEIAAIPGTYDADGVLQRWQSGTQTCAVMFKTDEQRESRAWDFLRWWLSTDTQNLYAESMENYYGEEFRWYSANLDVVAQQAWSDEAKAVLLEQLSWYKQLPMVPGGSYMTSRELWNAWTRIVVDKGNYREEIEAAIEDIQSELEIKQREMGYVDENGTPLKQIQLMTINRQEGE